MTKKELWWDLKENTYCRIMPSKIHGVGVFAIKNIPKGTWIFKSCRATRYYKFYKKELKKLPEKVRQYVLDMFPCEGDYYFVPRFGLNNIDISYFTNYSQRPNLGIKKDKSDFYALRDIKVGEELTSNYKDFSEEYCDF